MTKKFSKKTEDFNCEICGARVKGSGYTDHCPHCLWGKHVDVIPGDRSERCQGLMEPIGVIKRKNQWQILYRCQKCGQRKLNRVDSKDNQEKIIELSKSPVNYD